MWRTPSEGLSLWWRFVLRLRRFCLMLKKQRTPGTSQFEGLWCYKCCFTYSFKIRLSVVILRLNYSKSWFVKSVTKTVVSWWRCKGNIIILICNASLSVIYINLNLLTIKSHYLYIKIRNYPKCRDICMYFYDYAMQ